MKCSIKQYVLHICNDIGDSIHQYLATCDFLAVVKIQLLVCAHSLPGGYIHSIINERLACSALWWLSLDNNFIQPSGLGPAESFSGQVTITKFVFSVHKFITQIPLLPSMKSIVN